MSNSLLYGKKILLGITGGIAAYKTPYLIRDFIKKGAEVKVVMTDSAARFVTPETLATLSRNEVITEMFPGKNGNGVSISPWHIELSLWADLFLIAPATVNTIAKIVFGFADNPLTTLVTARRAPLLIAPAADVDMYEYEITQKNLAMLRQMGVMIIPAESGELASGLVGAGRLPENSVILDFAESVLMGYKQDMAGKKCLVTAGPTYEDIDPVRYLGNRSSGKMGFALARALYTRGAEVTLISGPSSEQSPNGVTRVNIRTAEEMMKAVHLHAEINDVLFMAAAVADFIPAEFNAQKIKKTDSPESIALKFAPDILASVKEKKLLKVGFALETQDGEHNALEKLQRKGLDMIVLNQPGKEGTGFEYDTNKVTIYVSDGTRISTGLESKFTIAHTIINKMMEKLF